MSCVPGMPCYDENNPPALPEGVSSSDFIGYPIISGFIYYAGQFLPNTGIATNSFLTTALQQIDPQLSAVSIAEKILNRMQTNPAYNAQICQVVYECAGGTTTTTTSTSTSTSTTTSTSTSTSTSTTSTTTSTSTSTTSTTTTLPPCDCHTAVNYTGGSLNVYYTNCAGVATTLPVASSTIIPICARSSFAITADPGLLVYNCLTSCTGGIPCSSCAPATTTSTSTTATPTTTTTTTVAPTTTTTTTVEPTTTTTTTVAPTTTTTTTLPPSDIIYLGNTCPTGTIFISGQFFVHPGDPVANGTVVYTTAALNTVVPNGIYVWYAGSGVYTQFTVSGGNGTLQDATDCSQVTTTTTTTIAGQTTTTTTTVAPTTTTTTTAAPATTTTTTTEVPATTTTTTTASPTTTTTTTAFVDPYDYYEAQIFSCATCQPVTVPPYPSQFTTVKVLRPFTANLNAAYNSNTPSAAGLFFDLVGVTTGPATIVINPTEYTACYAVCGQTTTTTTTATPTTTTTTTLPPITLTTTPGCTGGANTGTVYANNFSGGTESFEYITISGLSAADALTRLDNPATRTLIEGATDYTFTSLGNNTYYVAIMDFSGNKGASTGAIVNCITTTTTTTTPTPTPTTTTTTTADPYVYYNANVFDCTNCGPNVVPTSILKFLKPFTVDLAKYYISNPFNGKFYRATTLATAQTATLMSNTVYTGCYDSCGITTTTTTTTIAFVSFSLTYSSSAGSTACTDYATPTNRNFYYAAAGSTLTTGTILYTTSALTTPVANGYYSNGVDYWNTAASVGNLQNQTPCVPPITISLGSAYCADVACMTTGGSAVVPCGGGYNVNIANAPAGYTVTMTYSVQGGADGSYANLLNPSTGVYKVRAWFAAAGSNIVITLSLRNSSNVEVAQSVSIVSRNSPSNFLGLPACSSPSNVTLSPQNSLDGNSYTVFINGVEDAAWNSGTRSYPAYTTIKVVYSSPACGVVLNSTAYTSNTTITVVDGNAYTFTLYNANNYVDTGSAYCEGCQRRQGTINDCGTTSYRVLADNSCDCGVSCAGTYYDPQECSGNALIRRQRYTCDNTLTGVIDTIDSCSCSCNAGCDGTYWAANECSGDALIRRQFYYCNNAYTGVTEVLSNCSCSCNIGCGGTCEHQYCDGTTLMGILRYNCNSTGGVCNGTDAGSPYVIAYNSTSCGYTPSYSVMWSVTYPYPTGYGDLYIYKNGALAAYSYNGITNSGAFEVNIGDVINFVTTTSTSDFGKIQSAVTNAGGGTENLESCDLYGSSLSGGPYTAAGDMTINIYQYNQIDGC